MTTGHWNEHQCVSGPAMVVGEVKESVVDGVGSGERHPLKITPKPAIRDPEVSQYKQSFGQGYLSGGPDRRAGGGKLNNVSNVEFKWMNLDTYFTDKARFRQTESRQRRTRRIEEMLPSIGFEAATSPVDYLKSIPLKRQFFENMEAYRRENGLKYGGVGRGSESIGVQGRK